MDTNYDPFEKHRNLIEYLMLGHISSFSVNTHMNSMIAYSEIMLKEVTGPLNEDQKQFLSVINNNARYLYKHINTFITASRLIFKPEQVYLSKFRLSEPIDRFIKRITKSTEFKVDKVVPENLQEVEGDASLMDYAFDNIEGIVAQIHPEGKGDVKVTVNENESLLKFTVSTNQERVVDIGEDNIELFIVQFVVDLHGGSFEINYDNDRCNLTFTLPIKKGQE